MPYMHYYFHSLNNYCKKKKLLMLLMENNFKTSKPERLCAITPKEAFVILVYPKNSSYKFIF